jgi:hypothetical protein
VVINATLIYFHLGDAGTVYAVATAALLIPSVVLGRWLYVT